LALYLVLLATTEGLGLFAARGACLVLAWPTGIWLGVSITGLVILVLGIIVIIVAYQRSKPTPPDKPLPWIAGVLLSVTVGLETFLLSHAVTGSLDVWHWIVAVGMILAIYMQLYWVYSAWRSGLYRQKPSREWREGPEKIPSP
jgi:4-hydroxybenzoate polyprenyltransferase